MLDQMAKGFLPGKMTLNEGSERFLLKIVLCVTVIIGEGSGKNPVYSGCDLEHLLIKQEMVEMPRTRKNFR